MLKHLSNLNFDSIEGTRFPSESFRKYFSLMTFERGIFSEEKREEKSWKLISQDPFFLFFFFVFLRAIPFLLSFLDLCSVFPLIHALKLRLDKERDLSFLRSHARRASDLRTYFFRR